MGNIDGVFHPGSIFHFNFELGEFLGQNVEGALHFEVTEVLKVVYPLEISREP